MTDRIDTRKFIFSALWSAAGGWGRQIVSLLILIVSARLLTPAEFGLISIPAIVLMVKESSLDWAMGETLVRRADLGAAQLASAFWFNVSIGLALAAALVAGGGAVGGLIGEPRFAAINAALAVCYPLGSAAAVLEAKLRRDLDFRILAIRPLVALSLAGAVSIAMILLGFGVWALVAQIVVEKLAGLALLLAAGGYRPGLALARAHVRPLLPDFLSISGAQLLSQGARNIDRIAVGLFFPPAVLGAYMLACRVLETSATLLLQGANKVAYVLFSRLQDDREQIGVALVRASEMTAIVAVPAFVGLSLLAPEVVTLMFGDRWIEAGVLLQILILTAIPQVLAGYTDSVARATGRANWFLVNMGLSAAVTVAFLAAALPHGPLVVASVPLVREVAGMIIGLLIVRTAVAVPVGPLLRGFLPVILSAALMAVAIKAVRPVIPDSAGQVGALALCIFVGVVTYAFSILLTARTSLSRTWAFVRKM
jgi:O-antigen/teichoic acid export membrane protein